MRIPQQDVTIQNSNTLRLLLPGMSESFHSSHTHEMPLRQQKLHELGCRLGYQGPRRQSDPRDDGDKLATGDTSTRANTQSNKSPASRRNSKRFTLNVLQLNICGLQNKRLELARLLSGMEIHIALLQETILPKSSNFHLTGYTMHHCRCNKCQGIATLVRNDITAEVSSQDTNDETDIQEVTVYMDGNKTTFYNIYCPPRTNSHQLITALTINKQSWQGISTATLLCGATVTPIQLA